MKQLRLLLLFLLPIWASAQVSTGSEQQFDYGLQNLAPQTITTPPYLGTLGIDGTMGQIPSAYIEKTAQKQTTPIYDGTGAKYPALDLMNSTFLENTKLFARTGITSKGDQFDLTVLDINTLRILPVDRAFFYNEIFGAGKIANDGFKSFAQKDYVLTQLVTATGGNINIDPIVSDGKTARFIGYNKDGNIVSSIDNFANNPDVVQLGFVTVVKSGSSVQFLDITPGGRNCAANPILANLNDLDRTDIGLSSNVKIGFNTGTPTINSSNGVIKKAGANWRGVTNPGNSSPIDYLSYTGQATLSFAPIDPTFATSTAAITPITTWTTTVGGIAFNQSFWNTTTVAKGTMANNAFSIKRVIQGIRGGIFLQDAEHATTACFSNLAEAQSNLYKVGLFSEAIVPPEVGTEIARIIFQKSVTDFTDNTKFIIYPSGNAGGNSSPITPVSDATTVSKGIIQLAGDLGGTADSPTTPTAIHTTGNETRTGSLTSDSFKLPSGTSDQALMADGSVNIFPPTIVITTSVSITTATTGTFSAVSYGQNGKNVIIDNGVNAINLTCNGSVTASYLKHGTGAITFVQGSGRTLVTPTGTAILNGTQGSTATITSIGTTDYLLISNL